MPPDPYIALNDAVQAVRSASHHFPLGKQLAAQKAAAQVLLDRLPVEYRIWPDDEDAEVTLDHLTRDLIATARRLESFRDGGEAVVHRTLDRLVRELGYTRTPNGLDVPF